MEAEPKRCMHASLLLLLLLLLRPAAATKWFIFGRQQAFDVEENHKGRGKHEVRLEAQWFDQPLDHFDPLVRAEGRIWKQRYFQLLHSERQQQQQQQEQQQQEHQQQQQAVQGDVPPMFVYIGGEAEIKSTDITAGNFAVLSSYFAADSFALEHRFYGLSKPLDNSNPNSLRFLTVQQALADLASFIEKKRQERAKANNINPKEIPVIVFGCSYPGALAAFARLKYPFLITGAISSSSPVEAKENFSSYDLAVKEGLPPSCAAAAAAALAALNQRVYQETTAQKELERFGCEDVSIQTNTEKVAFVYSVVDAVAEAVQYNRPIERPLIEQLCSYLEANKEAAAASSSSNSSSNNSSNSSSNSNGNKQDSEGFLDHIIKETEKGDKKETKKGSAEIMVENMWGEENTTRDRDRDRVWGRDRAGDRDRDGDRDGDRDRDGHREGDRAGDRDRDRAGDRDRDRDREDRLLEGLAKYFRESCKRKHTNCKSLNILAATDTQLDNSDLSNTRLWMWQSCSQFGFWQVASPGGLRPPSINVQFHIDVCNKLFPLPQGVFADEGLRETNSWGGGRELVTLNAATNIHFTNGEKDPWRLLSLINITQYIQQQQHISAFLIHEGSHCTDFYDPSFADNLSLQNARKEIRRAVAEFINGHKAANSSSSSSSNSSNSSSSSSSAAKEAAAKGTHPLDIVSFSEL